MSQSAVAEHAEHSSFIQTPQQLVVVLLLAFIVPIIGIILIVHLVLGSQALHPEALVPDQVAARLQPVGRVEVVDPNAPKVIKTGEETVKLVCAACHVPGAANAPKIGDKGAWGKLAGQGLANLLKVAIAGKGAMPPRGGLPELTDFELARAIVHMANQSGANMKEPAPPADAKPADAKPAAAPAKAQAEAKKK